MQLLSRWDIILYVIGKGLMSANTGTRSIQSLTLLGKCMNVSI